MALDDDSDRLRWFSVRCLFRHGDSMYEERITLWRARDLDHAIELAEAEAADYSTSLPDAVVPTSSARFAQAFALPDRPTAGSEVFSLIRDSDLPPDAYLDRYFDTGDEHESIA